jgi:hypothetical protein
MDFIELQSQSFLADQNSRTARLRINDNSQWIDYVFQNRNFRILRHFVSCSATLHVPELEQFKAAFPTCSDCREPPFQSMGDRDLAKLPGLFEFIQLTESLLDRIPTVPDLLGLLFGLFPGAGLRGQSRVLPFSSQIEVFRTLTSSPLRLALSWAVGRVARVDGDSLSFGTEQSRVPFVHCKRVALLSCNPLALSGKHRVSY